MKKHSCLFVVFALTITLSGCAGRIPKQKHRKAIQERETKIETLQTEVNSLRQKLDAERQKLRTVRSKLQAKTQKLQFRTKQLESQNQRLKKELSDVEDATARQEGRNVVLELPEKVLFDVGKAKLHDPAKDTLRELGKVLQKHEDRFIVVEGHADTVPITNPWRYSSNWDLSAMRASNVVEFLVDETPVASNRFIAAGYGDQHPIVPNTSEENRRKNRRVEIVLYPPDLPQKELQLSPNP